MAKGKHPQRTPVYGGALAVAAMVVAAIVAEHRNAVASWAQVLIYTIAGICMLIGAVMTLRDLS